MSHKLMALIAAGAVVAILLVVWFILRRKSRKIRPEQFKQRWQEIQRYCSKRETWPLAVVKADRLLEEALRKLHLKGKSMGEKLVSAQRQLTDNDGIWYAHNLAKKIRGKTAKNLREADVKKALVSIRQALRDLGVMRDGRK